MPDQLILSARSARGRELISSFGARFEALDQKDRVKFTSQRGPWLLVQPVNTYPARQLLGRRWVHRSRDEHFQVEVLEERRLPEPANESDWRWQI